MLVVELPAHVHPLAFEVVAIEGAVCSCTAAGAVTDVAEELSPFALLLDEFVTTEGEVAAATFVGADTVVEPVLWMSLPALCCADVTDGEAASCTAVGADTDVVWALDPLDWLQVQPVF